MRSHPLNYMALALLALLTMPESNFSAKPKEPHAKQYFLYIGTYGKGIYAYKFDASTGKLDPLDLAAQMVSPSFLATDRNYKFLYAVSEVEGNNNGAVGAFAINRHSGALTTLNSVSSAGVAPCHLAVDHTGKMLIAANYTSGSVPAFPIEHDGKLGAMSGLMTASGTGPNKERQEGPHAHETVLSPDNRFAYVPDLGLDEIRIYRVDAHGAKLTPSDPPVVKTEPGSGPRHIAISSDGKFAYAVHELKPMVTVFSRDVESGALTAMQTLPTVPEGFTGKADPAEILLDHSGRFLYASNRTVGSIAVFSVDHSNGKIAQIQVIETGGTMPRGVEIDPSGSLLFVGDQKQNKFVLFKIDPESGRLTLTDQVFEVPSPVAFQFVPAQ